jgi:hypothetical protein
MITIHAGQCGNQLGFCLADSFFDHLIEDEMNLQYFFRQSSKSRWTSRSICVDTEPKVIYECMEHAKLKKKWIFDLNNVSYEHGGAGNNWALGYEMFAGNFRDQTIDRIRYEVEQSDIPSSLIVIHSVGGGTGSGLGTRLTEQLQDEVSIHSYYSIK